MLDKLARLPRAPRSSPAARAEPIAAARDAADRGAGDRGAGDWGTNLAGREHDGPVFDPARLKAVLGFLPPERLREFALLYLDDAADCANRIFALAANGDCGGVGRAAHQLVGVAGNYGAMETCRLAQALAAAGKAGDEAACRQLAQLLPAATERAAIWLRVWLDDAHHGAPAEPDLAAAAD